MQGTSGSVVLCFVCVGYFFSLYSCFLPVYGDNVCCKRECQLPSARGRTGPQQWNTT